MKKTIALFSVFSCLAAATWGAFPLRVEAQALPASAGANSTSIGPIKLSDGRPFRVSFVLPLGPGSLASPFVMQFSVSGGRVTFTEAITPIPAAAGSVSHVKVFNGTYFAPTATSRGRIDLVAFPGGPVIGSWPCDDGVMVGMLTPAAQKIHGSVEKLVFPLAASMQTFEGVDYTHTDLYLNIWINQ